MFGQGETLVAQGTPGPPTAVRRAGDGSGVPGERDGGTVARVLLKGGCVLGLDRRVGNLRDADVLVEDGRIAEIGRGLRARDAEVVDARDTIVMPGFVDAHRHMWQTLLRHTAIAGGGSPTPDGARGLLTPEDVYAATLVGLLAAAAAGITTVVDVADLARDERHVRASLEAHADAGLRTVYVLAGPPGDAPGPDVGDALGAARDLAARLPATTVAYGAHGLPTDDGAAAAWAVARALGLRIHAHVGATHAAVDRAVDRAAVGSAAPAVDGLLGDDVTLAHGLHLDDAGLDAVAAAGAAVALTPTSDMGAGLGPPPVQALLDRGIRPGLGVADELAGPGDLFAQMRAVQSVQHATSFDRKLAGKAGVPQLLSTREVIRFATVEGARAAGLADRVGTLAPGHLADLVVLRADRPNIAPVNDPIGAVVWGMDASNVDWVFVGGRPLVREGVPNADVARARDLATAAHRRLTTSAATPDRAVPPMPARDGAAG